MKSEDLFWQLLFWDYFWVYIYILIEYTIMIKSVN